MSETVNEWAAPCGCVVRYKFDPAEPAIGRKHTAVPFPGRRACMAHLHANHHTHYRMLREHHIAMADVAHPGHGWRLALEADGGIRDLKD